MKLRIRDENGKWLDSSVFRQEAINYEKNKIYCSAPIGTPTYMDYWTEQLRRCKEGYEVGGEKITGHHYMYLNFTQIQIVLQVKNSKASKKLTKMPDFWDGDYNYFWSLEIAKNGCLTNDALASTPEEKEAALSYTPEEYKAKCIEIVERLKLMVKPHPDWLDGGHHMIVGKARRKGYSYKNGAICANMYNTIRDSLTIIGAFDKKYLYPKGTMGMVTEYLSFLNDKTAWSKAREFVNKQEHKKASFKENINGIEVEKGYKSEVMAITFKDNPDAARGKDALYVLMEEAGKFPNLKDSFNATFPGLTAGKYITGQIVIFGTGGDMEYGTADFAEMFYHPEQFNIMPFINIWDENAENSTCGFFHPFFWNMEGFYDEQGNSDVEGAMAEEKATRDKLVKNSTSSNVLQKRVQEFPFSPSEAFLTVSMNDFPIVELRNQFNKIKHENLHTIKGQPCELFRDTETGKIVARPDLDNKLNPIWDYKVKSTDISGSVVIYEYPINNPPKGLYKIGFDPYRQAASLGSTQPSLASIYVYKGLHRFSYTRDTLVAQFVGRPYSPDDVNRIAEMLAELYNAEIMHENEVTHVKAYFERKKKLHLLAAQPDKVISKNIKESTVARVYGIHMVEKLKDAGEKYIKQWLLEERDIDENGNKIYNLETIYDPGLIEELILYNRKGNFDRVMSFMMIMFQIEEEEENMDYGDYKENSNLKDLKDLIKNNFRKH